MVVTFAPRRSGRHLAICRELDCRYSQSVRIRLLWCQTLDEVLVHVRGPDDIDFWLNPPKALARYAFEHPFALISVYPAGPPEFQGMPLAA